MANKKKKKVNSWSTRTCYLCNDTGKKFLTKAKLAEHIKNTHEINQVSISSSYPDMYWEVKHALDKAQTELRQYKDNRINSITNWIDSVAKINQAVSQAIGEGVDRRL